MFSHICSVLSISMFHLGGSILKKLLKCLSTQKYNMSIDYLIAKLNLQTNTILRLLGLFIFLLLITQCWSQDVFFYRCWYYAVSITSFFCSYCCSTIDTDQKTKCISKSLHLIPSGWVIWTYTTNIFWR